MYHKKEANEKIFLSLLEKHYKESSEFKWQLQELESELEDCKYIIIKLFSKRRKRSISKP